MQDKKTKIGHLGKNYRPSPLGDLVEGINHFSPLHLLCAIILLLSTPQVLKGSVLSPNILLFYGSSCAGKSTLAKELQVNLGPGWRYLDWDEYADQVGDELATEALLSILKEELVHGKYLIVDAQPCMNWHESLSQYNYATILVYAPLPTLIARDEARQTLLKRPEQRRKYARAYIYETYYLLYGFDYSYDCVDQISSLDLECGIFEYPLRIETRKFFQKISQTEETVPIYAKFSFDLLVRSDIDNIIDNMELIRSKFFDN